jgi:diaminopimelate epimerase
VRPRITGEATCTVDMGRAALSSQDFPGGPDDGAATLRAGERAFSFQHVSVGNPQCAIEMADGLEQLDLLEHGPRIENNEIFPNRTNVSFWHRETDSQIRARIFERGVGETMSSGTGAVGAAVAAVLRGLDSPVTVRLDGGELEVEVGEDLHVDLTGWALPVYRGELSPEFVEVLREI